MDEPKELSINLLEHKIGFAFKTPEERSEEEQERLAGQAWVKPRSNSSNVISAIAGPIKEKGQRVLSKTVPQEEDQIMFKEMLQCYIQVEKDGKDKYDSNRVAKEAAKIINGFSSLKSQIEDLKSLFIQLKKENQGTTKLNNFKAKITKQGPNSSSQKDLIAPKQDSPVKKKFHASTTTQGLKTQPKRTVSNSKRSSSQKNTFRSGFFGKSNLNGSMEAIDKNSIYSSEKHLQNRPKTESDRFKNIYSRFTLNRPLEGERRSLKSTIRKSSSKASGLKQASAKTKLLDSNGQYFETMIGSLTKPSVFNSSKRTAEILSLVNINNLYATLPTDDTLKKKIRKKFSSPNKSVEKAGLSNKKGLDSASKVQETFEEARMSTNTARVKTKKQGAKDFSKDICRKEPSITSQKRFLQDRSTYFTKTERGPIGSKNPLHFSLTKWERPGDRIPSNDRSVKKVYAEIETDKVRSSINSEQQAYQSAAKVRYSHMPGSLASSSCLLKKPSATTKSSTPLGQSLPKTCQSDKTEEARHANPDKQLIMHYLAKMRESMEPRTLAERRNTNSKADKSRKQVVVYREMINLGEEDQNN
jgi:hypothetical protein